MYSRKNIFKTNEIPLQCFFKAGNVDKKEYYNFLHIYYDADREIYTSDRIYTTSAVKIFNVTIIDWCPKKKYKTSRSSYNVETRAIYTGVLDQNCIRKFCR